MTRVNPGDNLGLLCRRTGWPSCGKTTLDRIARVNHLNAKRTLRVGRNYFIAPREVTAVEHQFRMRQVAYREMITEAKRLEKMDIRCLSDLINKYNPTISNIPEIKENFMYPVDQVYFSDLYRKRKSEFGIRIHPIYRVPIIHNGKDLLVGTGTPIHAANIGKVLYAGLFINYGYLTVLIHQTATNRFFTVYAHNSKNLFKEGDSVEKNQIIALSGATGRTTGPHLHFEFRNALGQALDPKLITSVDVNSADSLDLNSLIDNNLLDSETADDEEI